MMIAQPQVQAEEPKPENLPTTGKYKRHQGIQPVQAPGKVSAAVLAFAYHPEAPFTNNRYERELRPAKAKRK